MRLISLLFIASLRHFAIRQFRLHFSTFINLSIYKYLLLIKYCINIFKIFARFEKIWVFRSLQEPCGWLNLKCDSLGYFDFSCNLHNLWMETRRILGKQFPTFNLQIKSQTICYIASWLGISVFNGVCCTNANLLSNVKIKSFIRSNLHIQAFIRLIWEHWIVKKCLLFSGRVVCG